MAWKQLTVEDMRLLLSDDEITILQSNSISDEIITNQINLVSDAFRGAFSAKGYEIDVREHFMPASYSLAVLNIARVQVWSRFPHSPQIALDEVRQKEYERYLDLLKDPYIGTELPEWEYSSNNPESTGKKENYGSIVLPFLRFDEDLYYWADKLK
jgi:hypothetical protein